MTIQEVLHELNKIEAIHPGISVYRDDYEAMEPVKIREVVLKRVTLYNPKKKKSESKLVVILE